MTDKKTPPQVEVSSLTMAYGDFVVQRHINFTVNKGEIFIIMGDSGCGKSTLIRNMIGLHKPQTGDIYYHGESFWQCPYTRQQQLLHNFGVSYQSGALWSSMSLAENIALPLQRFTSLSKDEIKHMVALKLALVGLAGFEDFFPSQISGGMRKRAGLARAMALDPPLLFFDEPTGGLDPVLAKQLDNLILELRDSMGTTFIIVTHDLGTIFGIADNSIYLDSAARTMIASGHPQQILKETKHKKIIHFLTRST